MDLNSSKFTSFTCRRITCSFFLAVLALVTVHQVPPAAGAPRQRKLGESAAVSQDVMYNYLMEFDYLPKSDIETGALRTEAQLKEAIKDLQRFGNIPVTGEIDGPTRQLIMQPRCGVGDSNRTTNFSPDNLQHGHRRKRYVLQGAKWDKTDLTWSLVNQSMTDAGQVRTVLTQALRVWERSSKLTFREVYSDQADIQVLFARRDHGDGYKFDGPGQILAHAFYPGVGRGGDAHFDDDEDWQFTSSSDSEEGTNFMGVAVHEFGHSLGLGHSSDQKAIMYPWYHGYEVDLSLPDDDRTAIQELYGSKEKTWGPFKQPVRPKPTKPTTTTTTTTMRPLVFYPERRYPEYRPDYSPPRAPAYPNDPRYHPNHHDPTDPRRHHQHHNPHNPHYPHHHTPTHRYPDPRTTMPTTTSTTPPTTTTTTTTHRPRTDSPPRYPTDRPTKSWQHRYNTHVTAKPRKLKPDSCFTTYDAISMIRRELFIFRGQFLWRIGDRGLYPGYPTETRRLWSALPENFTKIDAAYENRDRKIVFFIGRFYYVFDSVTLERGYPQPLTSLGLPFTLTHLDAAFVWGHNNRTYLLSGELYWRLDEDVGRVELDYPRDMSIWSGIGYNIDAAFQYTNRKTYFFKGLGYWEFNDDRMMVTHSRPKLSARKWMNCPRRVNEVDDEQTWTSPLISERNETTPEVGAPASGADAPRRDLLLAAAAAAWLLTLALKR